MRRCDLTKLVANHIIKNNPDQSGEFKFFLMDPKYLDWDDYIELSQWMQSFNSDAGYLREQLIKKLNKYGYRCIANGVRLVMANKTKVIKIADELDGFEQNINEISFNKNFWKLRVEQNNLKLMVPRLIDYHHRGAWLIVERIPVSGKFNLDAETNMKLWAKQQNQLIDKLKLYDISPWNATVYRNLYYILDAGLWEPTKFENYEELICL